MTFTVTYRDRTGAIREERVEASSRSAAMAALKARGIMPIRVEAISGAPRRKPRNGEDSVSHKGAAYVLSVAFVLLTGGGLWWWFGDGRGEPTLPSEKHVVTAPTKKPSAKPVPAVQVATPPPANVTPKQAKAIASTTVKTNANGTVVEKLVLADGTKKTRVIPPPPVFDNACDQVIALAISTKPGEAMPPLPDLNGIDEDFARSLLSPIKISDDDPDDIKELKKNVIEVKKQLVEEVKNGKSVMTALLEHQAEMARLEESRLLAIREMQRLSAEDGLEMAQEFAKRVNEDFKEKGIPAIPVIGTHNGKARRMNK